MMAPAADETPATLMPKKSKSTLSKYQVNALLDERNRTFVNCFVGVFVTFTLNGLVMEHVTSHLTKHSSDSDEPSLSELILTCFLCLIFALVGYGCHLISAWLKRRRESSHREVQSAADDDSTAIDSAADNDDEKVSILVSDDTHHSIQHEESQVDQKKKPPLWIYLVLAVTAFGSTFTSIVALRYISFVTRILGKSCKALPVMAISRIFFGKRYSYFQYMFLFCLTASVACFLYGTSMHKAPHGGSADDAEKQSAMLVGGTILLLVSLTLDGATGALEDHLLFVNPSPYLPITSIELMYKLNLWKGVYAGICFVVVYTLDGSFADVAEQALIIANNIAPLVLLSLTGAMGQLMIFYTLQEFGAITTSLIGTFRKIASIICSAVWFGHSFNVVQNIGLILTFVTIFVQSYHKHTSKKTNKKHQTPTSKSHTSTTTVKSESSPDVVQHQERTQRSLLPLRTLKTKTKQDLVDVPLLPHSAPTLVQPQTALQELNLPSFHTETTPSTPMSHQQQHKFDLIKEWDDRNNTHQRTGLVESVVSA